MRLLWTDDSRSVVLTGNEFWYGKTVPTLPDGSNAYALFEPSTGQIWCNDKDSRHPTFTLDQIEGSLPISTVVTPVIKVD